MINADLLQLLRDCYTPSSTLGSAHRNIVDTGLVKTAILTPDTEAPGADIPGVPQRFLAQITLHAPVADDAANAQLLAQIENRLLGIEAISRVDVTLLAPLFPILRPGD